MSRVKLEPSGASKVPTARLMTWPSWTRCSSRCRNRPGCVPPRHRRDGGRSDGRHPVDVEVGQVRVAALGTGQRGADELPEQRGGTLGPALELRMGLGAHPERMALELDELDQAAVGRGTRAHEAAVVEAALEPGVELVAVAVPLRDHDLAVGPRHLGSGHELGDVGPEPHGPALVGDAPLGLHEVDHRVRRLRVELARVGAGHAEHVAGVLDGHHLHAEAQPQAGDVVLAGVAGRRDLPLDAALAEPTGDHDAVEVVEAALGEQTLDVLGLDPLDLDLGGVEEPAVLERLDDREVGVRKGDVLADDADPDRLEGGLDPVDEDLPLRQVDVEAGPAEELAHDLVEALVVHDEGDLVEVPGVGCVDDGLHGHVAEPGDLALQLGRDGGLAAAHDDVGLDAPAAELGDRVLGGLGLLLAGGPDERHQGDVQVADVVAADVEAELPDGLEERKDLDVADGAADLGDHDVDVVGGQPGDAALDLVGDVGDDLDGLAQVVTPALGGDDGGVDRTGGGVGVPAEGLVDEPLVVAEVEVGLAAIVGDEHLAVLERVHRARIDVEVRIELLHRDPEATALQQPTQR
jgi:hypothetical protein